MNTTMTTREFLNSTISVLTEIGGHDNLIGKANELIASLDHKNELRKDKPSKESLESKARRSSILAYINEHNETIFTREKLAEILGFTAGQVTSACTALAKDGLIDKATTKVDKSTKTVYTAKRISE